MNKAILNIEVQDFINSNLKSNLSELILKGIPFDNVASKAIIEQIEAKKRCKKKLPTWYNTENIYFPNKLNIEQTSSEITAKYKAELVSGDSLIDLTGGFGIDAFYFSRKVTNITHCEINSELSEIVKHNYETFNVSNIDCLSESGIDALKRIDQEFDWIYIDPSRRDDNKRKIFLLSDSIPNVKTFQNLFLKYSKNVMIKTSPLLDITSTLKDLSFVKALHVVAIDNEVKELLWILERNYNAEFIIKTINIKKTELQKFEFVFENESNFTAEYSEPLTYLYEPNSSILKAGAFNSIGKSLSLAKLHKHSHLYTSKELIEFPGRCFKIEKAIPFNKKVFFKEGIDKANITTRNFPLSVGDIRKKLKIKDGGTIYLFFTTDINSDKIVLICHKVN